MRTLFALATLLALTGCTTAVATKTANGVTESITVKSFLSTINNGNYTNGSGMSLSVSSATPDQQSIATLAGVVGDVAKAAMLMSKSPVTNSVAVSTNTTGAIIVTPSTPK